MADLTRDDVLKLAQLARLTLSDEEVAELQKELGAILQYVEQLDDIDVTGLEPTSQITGLVNVMREDTEINYGYEPRALLKNAPRTENNQLKVSRMVG